MQKPFDLIEHKKLTAVHRYRVRLPHIAQYKARGRSLVYARARRICHSCESAVIGKALYPVVFAIRYVKYIIGINHQVGRDIELARLGTTGLAD